MTRSTTQAARALFTLAFNQGGYFTAKQAIQAGYGYPHLEYHEGVGNFEKVGHGLYRLRSLPRGEYDQFARLFLWSRDRGDNPQAVVSHQSALTLHGLSDLLPSQIDLTVPKTFRKTAPPGVVLHKGLIAPGDYEEREGFRVTTPLRTLVDVTLGGISQQELAKATQEAIRQGLVRKSKILEKANGEPGLSRLLEIIRNLPYRSRPKG